MCQLRHVFIQLPCKLDTILAMQMTILTHIITKMTNLWLPFPLMSSHKKAEKDTFTHKIDSIKFPKYPKQCGQECDRKWKILPSGKRKRKKQFNPIRIVPSKLSLFYLLWPINKSVFLFHFPFWRESRKK